MCPASPSSCIGKVTHVPPKCSRVDSGGSHTPSVGSHQPTRTLTHTPTHAYTGAWKMASTFLIRSQEATEGPAATAPTTATAPPTVGTAPISREPPHEAPAAAPSAGTGKLSRNPVTKGQLKRRKRILVSTHSAWPAMVVTALRGSHSPRVPRSSCTVGLLGQQTSRGPLQELPPGPTGFRAAGSGSCVCCEWAPRP